MTREEQLDRMLQYLGDRKETDGLRELCERELGMNAEAYQALVDQLLWDGMAEWKHQDQLSITAEGRFLLIGGGYETLVYSRDYQKKQKRETRQAIVETILNRGRLAALRWGKLKMVVRERIGTLGRKQRGIVTRGQREATGRFGHSKTPNQGGPDTSNRSQLKTPLRDWLNETLLLRVTAVAIFISMLFVVLLLAT